jgi:hypothetical protein
MMGIFHRIMDKLGRHRLITNSRTGADYLHRYYLFLKNRTWFPVNVALHTIVQSDDPIFHNHPWPYLTIILKGGYYEHTPLFNVAGEKFAEICHWRGPGSIIWRKAKEFHWLELENNKSVATLFFMGVRSQEWGFLVEAKKNKHRWVKHSHYLTSWKPYHAKYIASRNKANSK